MNEEMLLEDFEIPMMSFNDLKMLSEGFDNFLPEHKKEKTKNAENVHAMITKAYADQGGIKGNGFASPEDMVHHIPMWKLHHSNGKLNAVALYKDREGRKRVAMASDGTPEGKKAAGDMVISDLKQKRAHMEVSGKSLSFMKKHINILDHVHPYNFVEKYHANNGEKISRPKDDDPEVVRHPELKDHMYVRKIGGHPHTKVMLGTVGKKLK